MNRSPLSRAAGAAVAVESLECRRLFAGIGSITGVVWNDINRDGLYTPADEPTMAQLRVFADLNNDGKYTTDEPSALTAFTGGGTSFYPYSYKLTDLPLGHYDVRVIPSATAGVNPYVQTSPASPAAAAPAAARVELTADAPAGSADFGLHNTAQRSFIAGSLFFDNNANGTKDTGESGATSRNVYVDLNENALLDKDEPTVPTDYFNANYTLSFYTVERNRTYQVRPVLDAGMIVTTPAAGYLSVTVDAGARSIGNAPIGIVRTPQVSVSAFGDTNGDGVYQSGETAYLPDRTFYLDEDNDGTLDSGETSLTAGTNTDSIATFRDLTPGKTYIVRQVLPAGWEQTSPANGAGISVTAQYGASPFLKFGSRPTPTPQASISGSAFKDFDRDGVKDQGEPVYAGNFIYLDRDQSGTYTAADAYTTSNANGAWAFTGLAPGTYTVRHSPGSTWSATTPVANGGAFVVAIAGGETKAGYAFGAVNNAPGVVGGYVYTDTDRDGVRDAGEAGVPDVYTFVDLDRDGVLDTNETVNKTDGSGYWSASLTGDLYAYRFAFYNNTGRQLIQPASGSYEVLPSAGVTKNGNDFGLAASVPPPVTGPTVDGNVFDDKNKNGLRELGEGDLSGITVWIDLDGDKVIDAAEPTNVTGADGFFEFTNVPSAGSGANTRLRVVPPSGATQTTPTNNYGYTLNLAAGAVNGGKSFGLYGAGTVTPPPPPPPTGGASISGVVFDDKNKNTTKDTGEAGLAGVTVWLDLDGDKVIDANEKSVVTLDDGTYSMTGLTPAGSSANTRLRAVAPSGRTQTLQTNLYGYTVNLTGTTANPGKNFGFYGTTITPPPTSTGTITGKLFGDANKNGVFDAGDAIAAARKVWLDLDDDGVLDSNEPSVLSDSAGNYRFTGLSARKYRVRRVFPTGYIESTPVRYVTIPAGGGTFGDVNIGSKVK